MQLIIRQEKPEDYLEVEQVIAAAFEKEVYSDHKEHLLVARLRKSNAFVPELSLGATLNGAIIGHILLTKIKIKNGTKETLSLALAPVSVKPNFQKKGIGGQLIKKAHEAAKSLGFKSIILLGHSDYYPKFGYRRASEFGVSLPFPAPDENCMALELVAGALEKTTGEVVYDQAFYE